MAPFVAGSSGLRASSWAAALVVVVALTGCKRNTTSYVDPADQIPLAEAKARAATVSTKLAAIARVNPGAVPPTKADAIAYPGGHAPSFTLALDDDNRDVVITYADLLAQPAAAPSKHHDVPGWKALHNCATWADSVKTATQPTLPKKVLQGCTHLRTLLVIRLTTDVAPEITGKTEQGSGATKTVTSWFKKGRVEGDVIAFDIDSGRALGGVRFAAETSDDPSSAKNLDEDLDANMAEAIRKALWAAPGAPAPAAASGSVAASKPAANQGHAPGPGTAPAPHPTVRRGGH